MPPIRLHPSDIAFTPTVKSIQARKGSRAMFARMEETGGWKTTMSPRWRSPALEWSLFTKTRSPGSSVGCMDSDGMKNAWTRSDFTRIATRSEMTMRAGIEPIHAKQIGRAHV